MFIPGRHIFVLCAAVLCGNAQLVQREPGDAFVIRLAV